MPTNARGSLSLRRLLIAIAVSIAWSGSAQAKPLVVTASTVPSLKAGQVIDGAAALTVPAGAKVTLIGSDGKVVNLTGPYSGTPDAGAGPKDDKLVGALATLVTGHDDDSSRLGVVRKAGVDWRTAETKSQQDVLAIDASDGGDACLYEPGGATLMRDPTAPAATLSIHAMDGSANAEFAWPKGTVRQAWPKSLPLSDGQGYVIEQSGASEAAMVTVHLLPAKPAQSDIERVAQLAEAGCTDQAKLLLGLLTAASK